MAGRRNSAQRAPLPALIAAFGKAAGTLSAMGGAGASFTIPHKEHPVGPSAMAALSWQVIRQAETLQGAARHHHQSYGATRFPEWPTLAQRFLSTSRQMFLADETLAALQPDPAPVARPRPGGFGLIHAGALTFALVGRISPPRREPLWSGYAGPRRQTRNRLPRQPPRAFPHLSGRDDRGP